MQQNRAYKAFKVIQQWKPASKKVEPEVLFDKSSVYYPLFLHMYNRTMDLYSRLPPRKNGEDSFLHPLNVMLALKESNVTDEVVLLAGLVHDIIEERVDLHRDDNKIAEDAQGIVDLDQYEETIYPKVEQELKEVCQKNNLKTDIVNEIMSVIKLLTRHKRDFYYRSICNIFEFEDKKTMDRAITVKLADRMHNILCIECFSEERRLYQCFKNLFILNSTKKYILENYGTGLISKYPSSALGLLFKRCCKATYEAFLTICHLTHQRGIGDVKSLLQLAFKKFALERSGAKSVTSLDINEWHPIRLYGGIIRKYDFRLVHNWSKYDHIKVSERNYCKKFFVDFNYSNEQIQAIIDYKDAYALKETIAYLLYWPEYILEGFEYSDLFNDY
tara:strand:- start:12608 stop:13771 length:1164 start_codon:yes stop_codon:yes gene_type:complete